MKVVLFAYQELGYIFLKELLLSGFEVALVVTHNDNPNEKIWFPSVTQLAEKNNIKVLKTDTPNTDVIETVKNLKTDVIFSAMFRKIIPTEILNSAKTGAFNLHPSLLPKYRGRCPANWALINGEKETGLTIHKMTETPDGGDILSQVKVDISIDDTIVSLYQKFADTAPKFISAALKAIKDETFSLTPQDDSKATVFSGRKPKDGLFNFNMPAEKIHNLIRAVTDPYPGAFCTLGNKKLFIWKSAVSDFNAVEKTPGEIISLTPLTVQTAKGILEIKRLQWENEKAYCAADFIKKYNLKTGSIAKYPLIGENI